MKLKRFDLAKKTDKKDASKATATDREKQTHAPGTWEMTAEEALKVCYVS